MDSKTNEREGKSRVERPPSSRKNRGRGGYRPWSEGRRSDRRDDRWSGPTKSFEKKKDFNKHSRGGTSRVSTAGRNRKDDNKPLGSEELSEKNLENEPQRLNENAGLPLEKGVQTRPWKGALTSSTIDNFKMRDTNSISRKNEVENNTSTYRERTNKADNNKRKISSKDKDVQYKPVPESSSLGVNTPRDPPDCTPPESISKNQSKVVEPSQKNKTRQKRDNYKSYSKSEGKEVDKRKYPKSSSSDKKPEQSKARPDSGVVAPPPGFETFVNKSGGRRPPPGFENNDSSIPKPPGF